jgi:hypothetical protein
MKNERPKFVRALFETLGREYDERGFIAITPYGAIGSFAIGASFAYWIPESDLGVPWRRREGADDPGWCRKHQCTRCSACGHYVVGDTPMTRASRLTVVVKKD